MGTAFLAVLVVPMLSGLTGCVSQAGYRQAISDREAEIRSLREERAALKGQLQSLRGQLEDARVELASSSTMPAPVIVEAQAMPAQSFPELDSHGITYGMRDGQMVISVPASVSFRSGSASLSAKGKQALSSVASTLLGQYGGAAYFVEGHTDSDPIKKSKFASNRALSLERAMAVLTYMVEECGIPDEDCKVVGHGQYNPVEANDSQSNKAKNRRVEIVVAR
jgi:chemotaxis protein MotB